MNPTPLQNDSFKLDRVAFYGRTLEEYLLYFDLDIDALKGVKTLDCPAGTSSFVAQAREAGVDAVGLDMEYGADMEKLKERWGQDVENIFDELGRVPHLFNWDYYRSPGDVLEHRERALKLFMEDYPKGAGEGRYIKGALPHLPFEDGEFELVLSGHFLFTYSDRLDYQFHYDSIIEMIRVSSNTLKIYPLCGLDTMPVAFMQELISDISRVGHRCELRKVPFRFQQNSDTMLQILKQ